MGPLTDRYGYDQDEIDQYAREILHQLMDLDLPIPLILLSLCRAITIVATEEELDTACLMLDEMRDLPTDEFDEFDR